MLETKKRYRSDIQVLRGVCILGVLLFHASESSFPNGYLGVDVFFVISGFVVTPLIFDLIDHGNTWSRFKEKTRMFFLKRFFRLMPALLYCLLLSLLIVFFFATPLDHGRFAFQGIYTLFLVGNIGALKYSGNYFDPNPNPLVHSWSLAVEEQIYIALPVFVLGLAAVKKLKSRINSIFFIVLGGSSFVLFLFPNMIEPLLKMLDFERGQDFAFYSPWSRVWQFLIGGIASYLLPFKRIEFNRKRILLGFTIIFALILVIFSEVPVEGSWASMVVTFLAFVSLRLSSFALFPHSLKKSLAWLGDRSYSIYLIHMPILYIVRYSQIIPREGYFSRNLALLLGMLLSVLVGAHSYKRLESRFRLSKYRNSEVHKLTLLRIASAYLGLICLYLIMLVGSSNAYFGLDRNIQRPAYAGYLDKDCARDSELGPPCVYKTNGARNTVLLIGDSHAGHISQALIDSAKGKGWNAIVWVHDGCKIQLVANEKEKVSENCAMMNRRLLTWLDTAKPDLILVSQFINFDSDLEKFKVAIKSIQSKVTKVVIATNSPIFPDHEDFMKSRPLVMKPYVPPTSFPVSMMDTKDLDKSKKFQEWASTQKIPTIDFTSIFCDTERCIRKDRGEWLFRDANHFSVYGANLLIPILDKMFNSHSSR